MHVIALYKRWVRNNHQEISWTWDSNCYCSTPWKCTSSWATSETNSNTVHDVCFLVVAIFCAFVDDTSAEALFNSKSCTKSISFQIHRVIRTNHDFANIWKIRNQRENLLHIIIRKRGPANFIINILQWYLWQRVASSIPVTRHLFHTTRYGLIKINFIDLDIWRGFRDFHILS